MPQDKGFITLHKPITQANQGAALPNISHDPDTMAEIRSALAVGKEVITHTDAVSVPGWSGAGYIIFDPQTGSGAYKIGGGQNGSYLKYVRDNLDRLLFWLSELSQSLVNVAGGVLARTLTSAIQSIQLTITFINLILSDRCPLSVAITGVVSISVFVGQATVLIAQVSGFKI